MLALGHSNGYHETEYTPDIASRKDVAEKEGRTFAQFKNVNGASKMEGQSDILWKNWIERSVKPYFLAPYKETHLDSWKHAAAAERNVNGAQIKVERYIHGLAHGMRQGALAKDILQLLDELYKESISFEHPEGNAIVRWAYAKLSGNGSREFLKKLELVSSFQRSGRECDVSHSGNLDVYKRYEMNDTVHFIQAAEESRLFESDEEIQLFSEALLWSNPGTFDELQHEDLRYMRRILRAAHTLDLRRSAYFDGMRLRQDSFDQLFGGKELLMSHKGEILIDQLWERSGEYLAATGDTDLVGKRPLNDVFFLQTKYPHRLVNAIHAISKTPLRFPSNKIIKQACL